MSYKENAWEDLLRLKMEKKKGLGSGWFLPTYF
jgi:hypothetical protein